VKLQCSFSAIAELIVTFGVLMSMSYVYANFGENRS